MDDEVQVPSDDEVIRLGFYLLENDSPVDLLLRLGSLDLWRGDLAVMRADPASVAVVSEPPPRSDNTSHAEALYESVFMKRALQYLAPRCREVLRLRYVEGRDTNVIATEMDTTLRYADKLVESCWHRAYQIVETIKAIQPNSEAAAEIIPEQDSDLDVLRKTMS